MTPSAVRAMDKNTNAVANEAWKTVIIHCRTEFIAFIDKTIKEGCFIWNDYTFNDEDSDEVRITLLKIEPSGRTMEFEATLTHSQLLREASDRPLPCAFARLRYRHIAPN